MKRILLLCFVLISAWAFAQETPQWKGKFEQLEQILPTPNEYRTGSGSPGPKYWQQKADYEMSVELNDVNQSITGSEKITYHNNSPDVLKYLWVQLDQNLYDKESNTTKSSNNSIRDSVATKTMLKVAIR
jgi:hypothetical protein